MCYCSGISPVVNHVIGDIPYSHVIGDIPHVLLLCIIPWVSLGISPKLIMLLGYPSHDILTTLCHLG
jgi:hypothetical protein